MMSLQLAPLSIKAADRFVADHHRHHKPTHGKAKFALAAMRGEEMVGVIIAGRPKAGPLDDGTRLELVRICTHGDDRQNAVSFLIGRSRRAAQALGYTAPLITYIEQGEDGASLIAAGFCKVADVRAGSWDRAGRRREDTHAIVPRERWEDAA